MKTIKDLLKNETYRTHRLDGEILLAHVLGVTRSFIHARSETVITEQQLQQFLSLIKRRLAGEPLAYLIGFKEFWSLELKVSPKVLIPRPETELLVELALRAFPESKTSLRILDLGTGSGAIALALAIERPHWQIIALDRSIDAIHIAKENATHLLIKNVEFHVSDWFSVFSSSCSNSNMNNLRFDIIIGNPPYLTPMDEHLDQPELQHEPEEALVSAPDGLEDLRHIIRHASGYLNPKGWLMLEHGYDQGPSLIALMQESGFKQVRDYPDLAGISRVVVGQKYH